MARTTKKQIDEALHRLASKFSRTVGAGEEQWAADFHACSGGWVVIENMRNGGEDRPMGARRRSAKEFEEFLNVSFNAICNYRDSERKDKAAHEQNK